LMRYPGYNWRYHKKNYKKSRWNKDTYQ
jgi:hypothetical protein